MSGIGDPPSARNTPLIARAAARACPTVAVPIPDRLYPPPPREIAARKAVAATRAGRVLGYVRVSTDEQAESGQSLAVQEQQIRGWAMQHGAALDAIHIEPGISGAIAFSERPEGPATRGGQWTRRYAAGDGVLALCSRERGSRNP